MAYSDKVIDHYENTRNVVKWDPAEMIGMEMVVATEWGNGMRLKIKV